jgi:predicted nuclease with TOPRIM domain
VLTATQNSEFICVVAERDGLAAELGAQTLRQQQLQEENRVFRVQTSALQENFDDLLSRVNWVNDRVNKLAQILPDKHA